MKFVIFTILFAGVSFAFPQSNDEATSLGLSGVLGTDDLLSSTRGLAGVVPALQKAAPGLQQQHDDTSKLAESIAQSADVSSVLSSLAEALSGASSAFEQYAEANRNLAEGISNITDESVLKVNLLNLDGINDDLDELTQADYGVSSVFSEDSTSAGSSGDISDTVKSIEKMVEAKRFLIASANNLGGVSGAAFAAALDVSGVTTATGNAAKGVEELAEALQNAASALPDVDFNSTVIALKDWADVLNGIVDAINNLISVNAIGNGPL